MIKLKVDIYALRTSQKEYLSTGDEATPKSRALNVAVRVRLDRLLRSITDRRSYLVVWKLCRDCTDRYDPLYIG